MKIKITDKRGQAEISEIFSSLQGEGPYLGVKQVFVRFGRCNMHCTYCDELDKMKQENFTVLSLAQVLPEPRVTATTRRKAGGSAYRMHRAGSAQSRSGRPLYQIPSSAW